MPVLQVEVTQELVARLVECGADGPGGLELVLFFHRHPRAYLPTDRLIASVGHAPGDVEAGIRALVHAGVIHRRRGLLPGVAMYRLVAAPSTEWLAALRRAASTPRARRQLQQRLREQRVVRQAVAARTRAEVLVHQAHVVLGHAATLVLALERRRAEGKRLAEQARVARATGTAHRRR